MNKTSKNNSGLLLITILAIIPLVIWALMSPLTFRFSSSSITFRSLGQVTGLLGTALLSINFILAARFKFLEKFFKGLNIVYVKHHSIGIIAFCLLLFHPTFLIIQYLYISLKSSFLFVFSFNDGGINLGKIALLVFIILIVITIYFNFKYQNWKNTHKFLGVVLFLGSLHMFLVPSDISNNDILKYYMLGLACLGAISYLYRTILGLYKIREYEFKLEKVLRINDNIVELIFSSLGRKMMFIPGQFAFLRFKEKGVLSESHPFSITSYPSDQNFSLGIKTLGDYTSMVYLLKPGAICRIEGPFGVFSYLKSKSKKQIWVAGGIGVTPFLSMARQINFERNNNYNINLFYSVKNNSEMAFDNELNEISAQNSNFRFHKYFSETQGYISADYISKNSNNVHDAEIFLCGPYSFMKSLREQFVKLGLDNNKIHSEEFSL